MVSATQVQDITITRTFDVPVAILYSLFTERDGLTQWLSDGGHVRSRVGGHFLLYWVPEGHAYGTILELEENAKAVFTWQSGTDSKATQVSVTITESDGQSELTLIHSKFHDEASRVTYEQQWNDRLDNLEVVLRTGEDPRITGRIIIGIIPSGISDVQAEQTGLESGTYSLISNLVEGYSAEAAGLKKGDIIVSVAGEKVSNDRNIYPILVDKGLKVGDSVEVEYFRDGEFAEAELQLKGYPVPEMPDDYKMLAKQVTQQYDQFKAQLDDLMRGASDLEASQRPDENEWNAKEVIAHLLLSERRMQSWIGSFMQGQRVSGFTANTEARIKSITAVYPAKHAIMDAFKLSMDETIALIDAIPEANLEDKSMLWQIAFNVFQNYWHFETHFDQIKDALAAIEV